MLLTAVALTIIGSIQKIVFGSRGTTLVIPIEEMKDMMKIV